MRNDEFIGALQIKLFFKTMFLGNDHRLESWGTLALMSQAEVEKNLLCNFGKLLPII